MRQIAYGRDSAGNTIISVGGRELATKVDIAKMVEVIKAHGDPAKATIQQMIKDSLNKDMHLNLVDEEKAQILSELMVQIEEAAS